MNLENKNQCQKRGRETKQQQPVMLTLTCTPRALPHTHTTKTTRVQSNLIFRWCKKPLSSEECLCSGCRIPALPPLIKHLDRLVSDLLTDDWQVEENKTGHSGRLVKDRHKDNLCKILFFSLQPPHFDLFITSISIISSVSTKVWY